MGALGARLPLRVRACAGGEVRGRGGASVGVRVGGRERALGRRGACVCVCGGAGAWGTPGGSG